MCHMLNHNLVHNVKNTKQKQKTKVTLTNQTHLFQDIAIAVCCSTQIQLKLLAQKADVVSSTVRHFPNGTRK